MPRRALLPLPLLVLVLAACGGADRRLGPGPVVCFGDSLTAGTGAPDGAAYPDVLARRVAREVVNAGVPGDTTESALARLEEDVLDRRPAAVLITLGGNDLKNGVEADEAMTDLGRVVERCQSAGAVVIVGGLDPPLLGRGYAAGYRDLCRRTGCVLVPDVFDGIMGRPDLMSDRIHPNAAGYERMAEHFYEALEPYL